MSEKHKTKEQLLEENTALRKMIFSLEHMPEDAALYRFLIDVFPDAVFLERMDGRIIECNQAALSMYGYTKDEILKLKVNDLVPDEVARTIPDVFDEKNTTGGVFVWVSSKKKNGTLFPVQYSTRIITMHGNRFVIAFVRDVTENYWRRHYAHLGDVSLSDLDNQGIPILNLTWEKREDDFILIGYDAKSERFTRGLISRYTGGKASEIYRNRPDIVTDLEHCLTDKAIVKRKTLYTMFTIKEDFIAEITYVFVPPNLVIMHFEDFTSRDAVEELNRTLVDSSPVGLCIIQDGMFQFVNPKFLEYSGYSEDELLRMDPMALAHPDDNYWMGQIITNYNRNDVAGSPYRIRIIRKDGKLLWTMVTATSILYKRKQAALINYTDFTELKETTDRLDELAALHSSILEAIPHAVLGLDNRRIVFANHAVDAVFGWKPAELIGKTTRVLFHSDEEYEAEGRKFYPYLTKKHTHSLEFIYKRKDGSDVTCLVKVSRIGNIPNDRRIVATYTDITELKHTEDSLKESQRALSTLMGNLPGMAYRCKNDPQWTMEFVSEGCYELTGYRSEDLINNYMISYGDLIHPNDRQDVWDKIQQVLKDGGEHFEMIYRIMTASHSQRWVWERGMGIYSPESGELVALEGFIADITVRVLAEKQLERSSKQLSIHAEHLHSVLEGERTEIAREIHDELGQIMTALKIDLFWLAKRIPKEPKETRAKADSMIDLIDSTIKTVQRISAELRPTMLDDLGLTSAIEWLVEEFQNRTGIVCEAILDPKSEDIDNVEKISMAVYRICQEALTNISRHSGATMAEIELKFRDTFVELIVRDNGRGINKNEINQTNSFGILGIKERTNLLGGVVMIRGRENKGTTIKVRIPTLVPAAKKSECVSDLQI